MTRAEAEQNLKNFGIEEPTKEQISDYLNQVMGEAMKEKNKANQYKEEADKAAELQKKLDEIESANLSEIEKATKALEASNKRVAELEKSIAISNTRTSIAEKFKVTADQASQIIKDDGSMDYDVLSQIIADKEIASANAKEQEIAKNAMNPGGGNEGSSKDDDMSIGAKMALEYNSRFSVEE